MVKLRSDVLAEGRMKICDGFDAALTHVYEQGRANGEQMMKSSLQSRNDDQSRVIQEKSVMLNDLREALTDAQSVVAAQEKTICELRLYGQTLEKDLASTKAAIRGYLVSLAGSYYRY